MRLSVSNYSFEIMPLEGTLAICKHMGFKAVDISGFHARGRCSFEPEEVAADPQGQADKLKALLDKYELEALDFFPQFGVSPDQHSINDPDPSVRGRCEYLIKGIAQFCKAVGMHGMTLLPGVDHPSRTHAQNMEVSAQALKRAVEIAGEYGIEVRFEPHMGSVSQTPELALQLTKESGAKVALDYSHFVLQYIPTERIHALIPYAGHVHVRAARPGKLQTSWREGTIDFVDIINRLKAVNYQGALSVEYVCSEWYDLNQIDTLFETIATKEALLAHVGSL